MTMNFSPTSMLDSPQKFANQTEHLLNQLLECINEERCDRSFLTQEAGAVVTSLKHFVDEYFKECQRSAAAKLHVDQLEKIIVRLRNENDVQASNRGSGRNSVGPNKIAVLESELESLQAHLEQANSKITSLTSLIDEKDVMIAQLHDELERRTADLDASCQALLNIQDNNIDADATIENFNEQLKDLMSANESLVDQVKTFEERLVAVNKESLRQTEALQSEIDAKQAEMEALTTGISTESAAYVDILEQINSHVTSASSMFAEHVTNSLNSLYHESERITYLQSCVLGLKSAINNRDMEISKLQFEMQEKETAIESSVNEAKLAQEYLKARTDELAEVQLKIEYFESSLENLTLEKAEVESLVAVKEKELSIAVDGLKDSQSKAAMLAEGFETMAEQVERYKASNQVLGDELSSEKVTCNTLREEIISLKAHISLLEQQLADGSSILSFDRDSLEQEITDLKRMIEDKNSELASQQRKHSDEMSNLRQELNNFQQKIVEMDNLLPQLQFQLAEAHRYKLESSERCELVQRALSESETLCQQAKAELAEKSRELDQTRTKIDLLTKQLLDRNQEIDELASKLQLLEKDQSEYPEGENESILVKTAEIEDLTWKLGRSTDEVERLEYELDSTRATIEDLNRKLSDTQAELDRANQNSLDEIADLRTVNIRLNEQLHDISSQIGASSEERKLALEKFGHFEREITRLSEELSRAEGEKNKLHEVIESFKNVMEEKVSLQNELDRTQIELNIKAKQLQDLADKHLKAESEICRINAELIEISKLESTNTTLQSEIERLQSLLSKAEQEKSSAHDKFLMSSRESAELRQLLDQGSCTLNDEYATKTKLEGEVASLKQALGRSEEEISRLLSIASAEDVEYLKRHCDTLVQKLHEADTFIADIRRQLSEEYRKNEDIQKLNDSLNQKLNEEKSKSASLTDQNQFLQKELINVFGSLTNFSQAIDAKFKTTCSSLEKLASRIISLQNNTALLLDAHRFLMNALQDVRCLVEKCPILFNDLLQAVQPALDNLESRVTGCQDTFSKLSGQISFHGNSSTAAKENESSSSVSCQTSACLVDISELESLQDILDKRDAELDQLTREMKKLSHRPSPQKTEHDISILKKEIEMRDDQLKSFSDEIKRLNERERNLAIEFERKARQDVVENEKSCSDKITQTMEKFTPFEEVKRLEQSLGEAEGHLSFCEQQLQGANQQILELVEDVKKYKSEAKRAERRFSEADNAVKSLTKDSQSMASIVASLREKLKSSDEQLAAAEAIRVQLVQQIAAMQAAYAAIPNPEQVAEVTAECDRLKNKVKFMTDQFELAVSRSALLERSLREKEEQCERLARELGLERQRLLTIENGSPLNSPSRESSPLNSHAKVNLTQYYEALPVPVKRVFDSVRHSQAAAATVSASQRFHRIVEQSPVGSAVRKISTSARSRLFNRMSPAKLQFFVTVYVCLLHMLTLFYMFTCYGPAKMTALPDADTPPHLENEPEDM